MSENTIICDFGESPASEFWEPVTDRVMGGLSDSEINVADSVGRFSGTVSLENNGGFSSIKSRKDLPDLTGYSGLRISIRGDGKDYQLRVSLENAEAGHGYKRDFATTTGEWLDMDLPFAEFVASNHGRLVEDAPSLDTSKIEDISFLIAGGQSGEFTLEIKSVVAYR